MTTQTERGVGDGQRTHFRGTSSRLSHAGASSTGHARPIVGAGGRRRRRRPPPPAALPEGRAERRAVHRRTGVLRARRAPRPGVPGRSGPPALVDGAAPAREVGPARNRSALPDHVVIVALVGLFVMLSKRPTRADG